MPWWQLLIGGIVVIALYAWHIVDGLRHPMFELIEPEADPVSDEGLAT